MDSRAPLLAVNRISVAFGRGSRRTFAVKDVSFEIARGETLGLVGESGSGKTTIGRAIMRLVEPCRGDILFRGERVNGKISKKADRELTGKIQMIFQDPMSSLNERAKVEYIVSEGLYGLRMSAARRSEAAVAALADVGLPPDCMSRFPHEFSGGQRQRIGIARALIMQPELIIADEPVSALDVSVRAQVLNLLRTLSQSRGLSCLFITHDLSVVRYIADRVAVIYAGEIVELAPVERLFERPLHPYTRALISAVPVADPRRARNLKAVSWEMPPAAIRTLKNVGENHFVLCTQQEFQGFCEKTREKRNVY